MIIDISQGLSPGMAGFPGDAAYEESWTFRIGPNCPVNVSRVAFSVHCGTHADAPLHYSADGATAGALSLEPYIGPCRVIDARGDGPVCLPEDIETKLAGVPPRVLLLLADQPDPKTWPTGFRALAAETVDLLASRGVVLVGIDTPSVDPETSKSLEAHNACRIANMRILENLVLAHVEPGDYELIALPLKFENLDASPVRAVLRRLQPS
ncbi:arylformamidase [Aestuariivirga sp.]|uniref:arylformamidase n=1 Tax=Aestuariivirga sp. TaxID=2650926 RepID=UPI0035942723